MSAGHSGAKHDEGKELQMQTGHDLMEIGKLCEKEEVEKAPEVVQSRMSVAELSKQGTTKADRELKKEKLAVAEEKYQRSRKTFPELEEFVESAKERGVDNDKGWEFVPEEEQERRQDTERVAKKGFWDKVPAAEIKEEVKRTLPRLGNETVDSLETKKSVLGEVKEHLEQVAARVEDGEWRGAPGWSGMRKHERMAWFVKSDQCQWLKDLKKAKKKKHKAMENVFEGCGVEPSEQERFKVEFALGESSESDSDSESEA